MMDAPDAEMVINHPICRTEMTVAYFGSRVQPIRLPVGDGNVDVGKYLFLRHITESLNILLEHQLLLGEMHTESSRSEFNGPEPFQRGYAMILENLEKVFVFESTQPGQV